MINLMTWFSDRQINFCPKHFVFVKIPITDESHNWIIDRLSGRFHISADPNQSSSSILFDVDEYPSFEDPQEAMLFQLTWS